jgi:cation diffusion facilitator family transporter
MYNLGMCSGKRTNSPALLANAYENRADALSAVAVVIGVSASIFIHPICDPLAAMLVGVHIFLNCIAQLKDSLGGLLDQSLPSEAVRRIRAVAKAQAGVAGIDFVKTRQIGTKYWVDLGIRVDERLNVCESDAIAGGVRAELMRRSEKLETVEVFVSPQPAPVLDPVAAPGQA